MAKRSKTLKFFIGKSLNTATIRASSRASASKAARAMGGKVFVAEPLAESDMEHKFMGRKLVNPSDKLSGTPVAFYQQILSAHPGDTVVMADGTRYAHRAGGGYAHGVWVNTSTRETVAPSAVWKHAEHCGGTMRSAERNPSSGAKQRSRGTRGRGGFLPPEVSGWTSPGSHHGWYMNEAADLRRAGKAYPPPANVGGRVERGVKSVHAELLGEARSSRPKLPNPGMDFSLHQKALAADEAWSAEGTRVFGKQWGNARYDARGVSTPELARLHAAFARTGEEWRKSVQSVRQRNPSSGSKQRSRGTRDFSQPYGRTPDAAIGARYLESAAELRATMGKHPEKRAGMRQWHKFDVESARYHRPKLPNPSTSTRELGALMTSYGTGARDPLYRVGTLFYAGKRPGAVDVQAATSAVADEIDAFERNAKRNGWGRSERADLQRIYQALCALRV